MLSFIASRGLPGPRPKPPRLDELFAQHPNFRGVPVPFSVRRMFALWQRLRFPSQWTSLQDAATSFTHPISFRRPTGPEQTLSPSTTSLFSSSPKCAEPKLAAFLCRSVPAAVQRADKIIAVSHQTKRDLVRLLSTLRKQNRGSPQRGRQRFRRGRRTKGERRKRLDFSGFFA